MGRIESFEFNDSAWCPPVIRSAIVEILGEALGGAAIYPQLAGEFRLFCEQFPQATLLDLCSGSGLPIASLLDGLEDSPAPRRIYLSDLYPNPEQLQACASRHPVLQVLEEPVDARLIPESLDHQAITLFGSLHHLPPDTVAGIMARCNQNRQGFFFAEPFPRQLRCFLPIFLLAWKPLLLTPFRSRRDNALKALLTFVLPLIPNALLWDGIASVLRIHSGDELTAMAREHTEDYRIRYREFPIGLGGKVTVFSGYPRRR